MLEDENLILGKKIPTFMWALVMAMVGRMSTKSQSVTVLSPLYKWGLAHTVILSNDVFEQPWRQMSIGIHGHDLVSVTPLRERSNVDGGLRVGEIRPVERQLSETPILYKPGTNLWSMFNSLLATAKA